VASWEPHAIKQPRLFNFLVHKIKKSINSSYIYVFHAIHLCFYFFIFSTISLSIKKYSIPKDLLKCTGSLNLPCNIRFTRQLVAKTIAKATSPISTPSITKYQHHHLSSPRLVRTRYIRAPKVSKKQDLTQF